MMLILQLHPMGDLAPLILFFVLEHEVEDVDGIDG